MPDARPDTSPASKNDRARVIAIALIIPVFVSCSSPVWKRPSTRLPPSMPVKSTRRAIFDHPLFVAEPQRPLASAPSDVSLPIRWLSASPPAVVLAPGLVVIKNALATSEQVWLAQLAMWRGSEPEPRGFWRMAHEKGAPDSTPPRREPNSSPFAGRGRVYDEIGKITAMPGAEGALKALAAALVDAACAVDAAMPRMEPTHVLLVHYSHGRNVRPTISWHKDNAPNDGETDRPVVAVSLGETADFELCMNWSRAAQAALDKSGALHRVRLESGDAILFGGPLRYIHHSIARVHADSCPPHLRPVLGDARISITFRDAPQVNAADYATFQPSTPEGEKARRRRNQAQSQKKRGRDDSSEDPARLRSGVTVS